MNLKMLHQKVRAHGRDFNDTIFRREDITMFINEGIDRFIQVLPHLQNINYLEFDEDVPNLIPKEYVHLLANYAVARLFAQDEQEYKATVMMNEFELKLEEFKEKVENGEVEIIDPDTGDLLDVSLEVDYVDDTYFFKRRGRGQFEEGV